MMEEQLLPMDIYIGDPTPGDIDVLLDLWRAQYAFHHELDSEYYVDPEKHSLEHRAYLEKAIAEGSPKIKVARTKEGIVGFATFDRGQETYVDTNIREFVEVKELFVAEAARRQGIAGMLMDEARSYAAAQGISHLKIQLSVNNSDAWSFYKKQGFKASQLIAFQQVK